MNRTATYLGAALAAFALCLCVRVGAQDTVILSRYVLSSAGGEDTAFSDNGLVMVLAQWNLGEPITEEFGSSETHDASFKRLTQGFEQGEGFISDPMKDKMDSLAANERACLAESEFKVVLWPNPARYRVYVEIVVPELLENHLFNIELRHLSGRIVSRETLSPGRFELGLASVASGLYLLSATDVATRKTFVCKLIKVL